MLQLRFVYFNTEERPLAEHLKLKLINQSSIKVHFSCQCRQQLQLYLLFVVQLYCYSQQHCSYFYALCYNIPCLHGPDSFPVQYMFWLAQLYCQSHTVRPYFHIYLTPVHCISNHKWRYLDVLDFRISKFQVQLSRKFQINFVQLVYQQHLKE